MAERIKGLQIDLSLDSMNVSQGLAGVKREMRALNSSMKVSNNNFKHGDKSASAYKDRMSELQTAVDGSSKHLDQLKSAHADVVAEQGAGSKAALDYANEINRETDTLNMFQSQLSQVTQEYKQNYSVAGRIGKSFGAIGSGMQTVGDKMQSVGSSFTSHITKPAGIAAAAVGGLTAKLGFDRLVGLDTAKAKLEGLGYSGKQVESITGEVEEAIDGSMTTMAEGTDVAAGAMAAGVEQGDELQRYIKLVGDAAVGSGRDVGSMAQIFNRVQGQGKLMTQELNMVEEGMPGFSNAMAKHLDVGVEKFREMVTEGEVSSEDFLDVMDDFAGGMAESYSQSWQGMLQNTKAYIGQIGESLLGGVFEQAKGSLHEFEDILKSPAAQEWAEQTGRSIADTFTAIGDKIGQMIDWWKGLDDSTQSTLGGIAKYAGIVLVAMGPLLTIFGKTVGMFGKMFSGLSTLITLMIKHNAAAKVSAAAQSVWNGVTKTAQGVSSAYTSVITALGNSQILQSAKTKIATVATQVWTGVTKAASLAARGLGMAFKFMTGPIGIIITAITAAVAVFMYFWKTNEGFRNAVIGIWNSIKNAAVTIFSAIGSFISNVWQSIKNVTMNVWNGIKAAAVTIWNGIKFAVQHPIQALKNTLTAIWNGIKTVTMAVWNGIKTGVVNLARGLWNGVRNTFNALKNGVTAIFNGVRSFAVSVWTAIKNTVVNLARGLWNGIRNIFNALKNGVTAIFNAVKSFFVKVWTTIKNTVVNLARGLWNSVRNTFNALKKGVTSIFNGVKTTAINIWTTIKNKVVGFAQSLWNGVKSKFNALKSGVSSIFNSVKDIAIKVWSTIKDKVQGFVDGMKDGVTGTVGKMRDSIEKIVDKIKGFFTDMVKGVVDGLNKLIDGVNWVGDKLGMGKIDPIKLSTGTEHTETRNLVTNGKVNQDTLATVGDKGRGNGPGGFRNEMIRYPNGKMFMTPNRDSTAYLPKGSSVYNGTQTHAMLNGAMPKFAGGTWWDKTKDFASGAFNKAKDVVGKGKDWLSDKVGDVMDWISKPGKLVDKVLEAFGVNFDWIQGSLPSDMMGSMFKKLKTAAKDLFTSWFDDVGESGEFDGSIANKGAGKGVFQYLVDVANKVIKKFPGMSITSGYRPGDKYYHGKRQAIDVAYPASMNGSKKYIDPANWAFNNFKDEVGYVIALNRIKDRTGDGGQGKTSKWANWPSGGHMDHLHINGRMGKGDISKGGASGKWGGDIKKALKLAGLPTTNAYVNSWKKQIQTESGGNPKALGGTDGLADGRAKGLVQVKPGTFNAHKLKGHGNIWNGLDNLIAGMRYAKKRYGKSSMLSFIGKGHGYSTGGLINTTGWYNLAEDGHGEYVIPRDPSRQSDAMKLLDIAANDIENNGKKNKRPNQMRAPVGNNSSNDNSELLLQMVENQQKQINVLTQIMRSNQNIEKQPKGFNENDVSRAQGKRAEMMAYNLGGAF
ncbi:tape measure protein [Tetragenococcus halophilus]|uniref:tape measure protein n=1 Tax=Tetragenococcus halophilus TaxID=51669 RepID=UPI0015BA7489|nr:tape measure protein [Tetragenococcus halophilus]NWN99253.1 tape measure protein [Tetragenococcus halophilus]